MTEVTTRLKHGVSNKLRDIWWILMLRGVLALGLAICALFWPQQTMGMLIKLLGAYFLFDGIASIIAIWRGGDKGGNLTRAVVSLTAGLALFFWTDISAKLFLLLIGIWALLQGTSLFVSSRRMESEDENRSLVGIVGAVTVLVGILFIVWPDTGTVAISWLIAFGTLLVGSLLIFLATRLKRVRKRIDQIRR